MYSSAFSEQEGTYNVDKENALVQSSVESKYVHLSDGGHIQVRKASHVHELATQTEVKMKWFGNTVSLYPDDPSRSFVLGCRDGGAVYANSDNDGFTFRLSTPDGKQYRFGNDGSVVLKLGNDVYSISPKGHFVSIIGDQKTVYKNTGTITTVSGNQWSHTTSRGYMFKYAKDLQHEKTLRTAKQTNLKMKSVHMVREDKMEKQVTNEYIAVGFANGTQFKTFADGSFVFENPVFGTVKMGMEGFQAQIVAGNGYIIKKKQGGQVIKIEVEHVRFFHLSLHWFW